MRVAIREHLPAYMIVGCLVAVTMTSRAWARESARHDGPVHTHYAELVQPAGRAQRSRSDEFLRESSLDHAAIGRSRLVVPHQSLFDAIKQAPAYDVAERSRGNGQTFVFTPFDGEQSYFLENLYTFDRGRVAEWRGLVRDTTGAAVGEATMRFYSDGRYRWHISVGARHLVVRSTHDPDAALLIEISNEYMRSRNHDDVPDPEELERAYRQMRRLQEQGRWQWEAPRDEADSKPGEADR